MLKLIKTNKLFKVLSLNSISLVVSFFLGIISTKLVSVFLGTSGMAFLGSFKNFSGMSKSLATIGINSSIVKLVVENKENKKELSIIYSTYFWIFFFISISLSILILFFSNTIAEFLFFNTKYTFPIQVFGLLLPLGVLNTFWIAIYNGFERFKRIIILQVISNLFIFLLSSFLIWKKNIFGGILSIALSEFVVVIVTFFYVIKDRTYFQFDLKRIIKRKYLDILFKFSSMALLSAIIVPLTLIIIRKYIVSKYSIEEAGIWDAVNRLSSFYMMIFSSGLSLYYMPKLASLKTDNEFKSELKYYFTVFVPLFTLMLIIVYLFKGIILDFAFTAEFSSLKGVLIWQLLGDLFRIMTLAFGYQIVVKAEIKSYFIIEIIFNLLYLLLSLYLVRIFGFEGALLAYLYASLTLFILVLWMFRKIIWSR